MFLFSGRKTHPLLHLSMKILLCQLCILVSLCHEASVFLFSYVHPPLPLVYVLRFHLLDGHASCDVDIITNSIIRLKVYSIYTEIITYFVNIYTPSRTQGLKIEGSVWKRFLPSPPPAPSFIFWLSFYFSRGQNRKSRSSVFLCSET